jgi:hypothetical protein
MLKIEGHTFKTYQKQSIRYNTNWDIYPIVKETYSNILIIKLVS